MKIKIIIILCSLVSACSWKGVGHSDVEIDKSKAAKLILDKDLSASGKAKLCSKKYGALSD